MPNRNIVVIGGSAGASQTLQTVLSSLDAQTRAAIFVVLHLQPAGENWLGRRLAASSTMPVETPDDEVFREGVVYVASADRHLMIDDARVFSTHGPRENLWRPAIDVLFRSAAVAHASRVIGVLLSGELDDGTSGLQAIKECGGITVVQDPTTATFPTMIEVALANVAVDYRAPADELAGLIARLVAEEAHDASAIPQRLEAEARMSRDRTQQLTSTINQDAPSMLSCPECGGPLWQREQGKAYRCLVGHAYHINTLASAHEDQVDRTLWAAIRLFEQRANIAKTMSEQNRSRGLGVRADIHATRADESRQHALRLRDLQGQYRHPLAPDER